MIDESKWEQSENLNLNMQLSPEEQDALNKFQQKIMYNQFPVAGVNAFRKFKEDSERRLDDIDAKILGKSRIEVEAELVEFNTSLSERIKIAMEKPNPQGLNVDKMFAYQHLPAEKQLISKLFYDCAKAFDEATPFNAEKTLTLRKLWEAQNLAVLANSNLK